MRVAVLYGGVSPEREVSLRSGKAVAKALAEEGVDVFLIDAIGDFFLKLCSLQVDVVFIALHGGLGENGGIQGMLEAMGIPYTGPGIMTSAICMHKPTTKLLLKALSIPIPPFVSFRLIDAPKWGDLFRFLGDPPFIIKPASLGSTIGVRKINTEREYIVALKEIRKLDEEALIEPYINGRELAVTAYGNDTPEVLPIVEIIPRESELYDYSSKYTPGKTRYIVPASISHDLYKRAKEIGLRTYKAVYASGYARIDMIATQDEVYVLEVNTAPGLTSTSLVPMSAKAAGYTFGEFLLKLINLALEKGGGK